MSIASPGEVLRLDWLVLDMGRARPAMRVVHCEEMPAAIESVHRAVRDSWIRRALQRVAQLELALSRDEGRRQCFEQQGSG